MTTVQPFIPWLGGKRRLAKQILPMFPEHTCYVEPFCGAAALFFLREDPAKVEVLNDINLDLVTLYRVLQHHLEEFVRQFKWALVSRQIFEWLTDTPPATLTDIQRAARFYYLQKLCFGGKASGRVFGTATTSGPRLNLLRIEEELSEVHLRLSRCTVEHLPWRDCVEKYDLPHTLFYLDPPYWKVEGYGVPFGLEEYEALAESLGSLKGKAILSINDHPEMRRVFGAFRTKVVDVSYSVNNRSGNGSPARELIVRNWGGS
ncbi:MAG: DNA adenine methylase [Endomicrobiales bacterium]